MDCLICVGDSVDDEVLLIGSTVGIGRGARVSTALGPRPVSCCELVRTGGRGGGDFNPVGIPAEPFGLLD